MLATFVFVFVDILFAFYKFLIVPLDVVLTMYCLCAGSNFRTWLANVYLVSWCQVHCHIRSADATLIIFDQLTPCRSSCYLSLDRLYRTFKFVFGWLTSSYQISRQHTTSLRRTRRMISKTEIMDYVNSFNLSYGYNCYTVW